MNRSDVSRLTTANSERTLLALTHQQHLYPARTVAETVRQVCQAQGYAGHVAKQALQHGAVDGRLRVGRLVRTQIRDLAERIELAWQAQVLQRTTVAAIR